MLTHSNNRYGSVFILSLFYKEFIFILNIINYLIDFHSFSFPLIFRLKLLKPEKVWYYLEETRFDPSPAATLGRAVAVPCHDGTIEPILCAEVRVRQPRICGCGRAGPTTHLQCSGVDRREMPSPPLRCAPINTSGRWKSWP